VTDEESLDGCARMREMGAEIALGIADGADRAWALDHLAECPDCRARIERLSVLADELLMLSPTLDPPAGFEAKVAGAIDAPKRRPWLHRRLVLPAVALAAAACAAAAVWFALSDDRELAGSYRDTLAVAHGQYFDAANLELPGGKPIGYLYGYQGRTSWVLAVIYDGVANGSYELEGVTADGEKVELSGIEVAGGKGSIGRATSVDYEQLVEVRLLDHAGREVAESQLRD
jgi:hypothetical protein